MTVTTPPAVTLAALEVTTYCVIVVLVVVIVPLVPVIALLVAVTVWLVPLTALVVKLTVATPLLFVVDVGFAKDPPLVELHVTVWPPVAMPFPLASTSRAVIVTAPPATANDALDDTSKRVAGPATVVTAGALPVIVAVVAVTT